MIKLIQKIVLAILLGLVFFFGGVSTAFAATETSTGMVATAGSQEQDDAIYGQLNCSNLLKMTLSDCVAIGVYYVIYKPAALFLALTGYMFDTILGLSIDSKYVNKQFVSDAWTVVRDFSNMLFIFILLYTGIMTMFGAADWRKVVLQVVIIALLINFSLFFTKVIIDAGNILAVGIRSSISPNSSISEGLASSFQPQQFLAIAGEKINGGTSIVIFLVATVVSGFAGYYFFKAALLFAGRLIAFWLLMIVSPFAFISIALPKGNVFSKWLDTLINQAFVAPVFLFFIYLIIRVISAGQGILGDFTIKDGDWFDKLVGPVIIATLLVLAIQKALKFTEGMAGDFGKAGSSFVSGVMGVAAIATGGVAGLARQTVGRYAAGKLAGGTLEEGSAAQKAAQWATRSSFDVRNISDKNSLLGKTISGKVFAKEQGIGGREKIEKGWEEDRLKKAVSKEMNIFERQGVRERAQKQEAGAIEDARREIAKLTSAASGAQKIANNSPTGKERDKAKENYDRAVANRSKGGSQEAVTAAKEAFEKTDSTHSSSPSSIALNSTLSRLKRAREAEAVALEKAKSAAEETVKSTNKSRRMEYADRVEKGGPFTKGRHTTADRIRKGEKVTSDKDEIEKLVTKMAEEKIAKEKITLGAKTETEGETKH